MSPFGLFDLLKTLLPTPDQSAQAPPSAAPKVDMEQTEELLPPSPQNQPAAPILQPEKSNACADFLYRHEQRAKGIKDAKKRLD